MYYNALVLVLMRCPFVRKSKGGKKSKARFRAKIEAYDEQTFRSNVFFVGVQEGRHNNSTPYLLQTTSSSKVILKMMRIGVCVGASFWWQKPSR